jgi:hypothetical protein
MHWHVPTQDEDRDQTGTFWVNACLQAGNATETLKKVTCKPCKALVEYPNTKQLLAARMLNEYLTAAEKVDYFEFGMVSFECNACTQDLDLSDAVYEHSHLMIKRIIGFLDHCAYAHMGGAEVTKVVKTAMVPAYALNYAVGKQAMTTHEERWRANTFGEQVTA